MIQPTLQKYTLAEGCTPVALDSSALSKVYFEALFHFFIRNINFIIDYLVYLCVRNAYFYLILSFILSFGTAAPLLLGERKDTKTCQNIPLSASFWKLPVFYLYKNY
jgi:hypothetical protein